MEEVSDEDIAKKAQDGDTESFGILVDRYEMKILRYARKFLLDSQEAEDCVQEVFIKSYVNIRSFDAKRKFSSWLYRIAHNEFINAIKKKSKSPLGFFDMEEFFPNIPSKERADDKINEKEIKDMLEKCLGAINPKYREVLILYYIEGFDYKTIADILRVPVSTVSARIRRGKMSAKKQCEKQQFSL